jgi:hypothetical protein
LKFKPDLFLDFLLSTLDLEHFGGRLEGWHVGRAALWTKEARVIGQTWHREKLILIDHFILLADVEGIHGARATLMHECCHAALPPGVEMHGREWQTQMRRLIDAGELVLLDDPDLENLALPQCQHSG